MIELCLIKWTGTGVLRQWKLISCSSGDLFEGMNPKPDKADVINGILKVIVGVFNDRHNIMAG